METLAAALLKMAQGERPLILPPDPVFKPRQRASSTTVTIVAVIVATVATAVIAVTATVRVANVVTLAKCSCTASKWAVTMA